MNKITKPIPSDSSDVIKREIDDFTIIQEDNMIKPETSIESSQKTHYFYLADDQLTREFSFDREVDNEHIIHFVFYKLNNILETPFLEFYLEKMGLEYFLPQLSLVFTQEDLHKDIDDAFYDKCSAFFQQKMNSSQFQYEDIKSLYKGFIESDKNVIVFFDCTNIDVLNIDDPTILQRWCILEEIISKKTIQDVPISKLVVDIFTNNRILQNIKNQNYENIVPSSLVYLCKKEGGSYINEYFDNEKNDFNKKNIIFKSIKHPNLGNIFIFSREPIERSSLTRIKRFAVFINEEEVSEKHINQFVENNQEFWYVKTPKYFYQL